jgi:hypothetical protein
MPKSTSCTRSRKASSSRNPLPYNSQHDIPPNPVAIRRLGANGIVLEPHHLPHLIQQLELRIRDNQVPAPNQGRQTATLVLTFPIPLHKLVTDANGFGRQVNSMFLG